MTGDRECCRDFSDDLFDSLSDSGYLYSDLGHARAKMPAHTCKTARFRENVLASSRVAVVRVPMRGSPFVPLMGTINEIILAVVHCYRDIVLHFP